MSTPVVDQRARDMAQAAASAVSAHEQVCTQRWLSTMATMKEIKQIIAWGITSLIAAMGGLIWYLATLPSH